MSYVKTISINRINDDYELDAVTLYIPDNGIDIISMCIDASVNNRNIYYNAGGTICLLQPGRRLTQYLQYRRDGEYVWCGDYLYAFHYKPVTAQKIIRELYAKERKLF